MTILKRNKENPMKKYRFEAIQKKELATIHQSFNVVSENARTALLYGIQHMVQDKRAISIIITCKPLNEIERYTTCSELFNYRRKLEAFGWGGMPRE